MTQLVSEKTTSRKKGPRKPPYRAAKSTIAIEEKKAAQMLEIFEQRRFENTRSIQHMRVRLVVWVIRTKITENIKRIFDLLIACLAAVILSPLMLVTAIAVRLETRGPIIYKQKRIGKWGEEFNCLKFRSMYEDAEKRKIELLDLNEADEIVFKIRNDPRITRVGRIIRKLSIDELPQLFNVIKGDMSLVGPRPPVPIEVEQYTFDHMRRLEAKPGITGLQQVSGRSDLEFKRWVELDLQYIQEQSLLKDIEILIKTIPAVLSGRGAY